MRIACIDVSAADRIALQSLFDESFAHCRSTIGHLTAFETFPCAKDEALLNSAPDAFAVGPSFGIEGCFKVCREFQNAHPETPILLFLPREVYTLRTLRRFESVVHDAFPLDETPIRIVHTLSTLAKARRTESSGKMLVVQGVKGGVGASSIVSGLAHAAESIGKTAVVLDLSAAGVFSFYMGAQRWQSSDHASSLIDKIIPDRSLLERCITTAPNGISMLLPPAGGTDVRERWLRDPETFELSLALVELLKTRFDAVLIDLAGAEGVLPFALNCRAHARLLVTSNDPASVHLLGAALSANVEAPGEGQNHVLVNQLLDRGLTHDDVLDFLYCSQCFEEGMAVLEPLPFDAKGRNWIGTGNSFFTESGSAVQRILEDTLSTLLLSEQELQLRHRGKQSLFSGLLKLRGAKKRARETVSTEKRALPFLSNKENDKTDNAQEIEDSVLRPKHAVKALSEQDTEALDECIYEAPKMYVQK